MVLGTTDRRRLAEQQLFEVNARLARARTELEILESQLAAINTVEEHARARLRVAETSRAEWECSEAHRRADAIVRARDLAVLSVAYLERAQDGLLSKLVG